MVMQSNIVFCLAGRFGTWQVELSGDDGLRLMLWLQSVGVGLV